MKIQPLADRVLIEPAPAEVKTAGGIYIRMVMLFYTVSIPEQKSPLKVQIIL